MKSLLLKYILHCSTTDDKINQYVPNSHIGLVFSEVYEVIEYYESGENTEAFSKCSEYYDFEKSVNEVFHNTEVDTKSVHAAYQMLREKRNPLRNLMKLLIIYDDSDESTTSVMRKRIKRGSRTIYKELTSKE